MICSICVEPAIKEDGFVATKCGHCFHKDCIEKWLEDSTCCPKCRKPSDVHSLLNIFLDLEEDNESQQKEILKLNDEVLDKSETIKDLRKCLKITEERIKELKERNESDKEKLEKLETDLEIERDSRRSLFLELKKLKESKNVVNRQREQQRETSQNSFDEPRALVLRRPETSQQVVQRQVEPPRPDLSHFLQRLQQDSGSQNDLIPFHSIQSGFSNQMRQSSSVSCKGCKTGCSKGYCACYKTGNGCSMFCGCSGCFNPHGRK